MGLAKRLTPLASHVGCIDAQSACTKPSAVPFAFAFPMHTCMQTFGPPGLLSPAMASVGRFILLYGGRANKTGRWWWWWWWTWLSVGRAGQGEGEALRGWSRRAPCVPCTSLQRGHVKLYDNSAMPTWCREGLHRRGSTAAAGMYVNTHTHTAGRGTLTWGGLQGTHWACGADHRADHPPPRCRSCTGATQTAPCCPTLAAACGCWRWGRTAAAAPGTA